MRSVIFAIPFLALVHSANAESFDDLAGRCAPNVSLDTLKALIKTESSFNPYAIAVVKGSVKQPSTLSEALLTVNKLNKAGKNYSVGLGQINVSNFKRLGKTAEELFDPCENLKATQIILQECYVRSSKQHQSEGKNLADALSCYYSGNFSRGYKDNYVQTVARNAEVSSNKIPSIHLVNKELNIAASDSSSGDEGSFMSQMSQKEANSLISSNKVSGLIF